MKEGNESQLVLAQEGSIGSVLTRIENVDSVILTSSYLPFRPMSLDMDPLESSH